MASKYILEIEALSASYKNKSILNNLNLYLEKGELACLLGESGSGKSTLMKSIAGFHPIDTGKIHICGEQVSGKKINVPPSDRKISIVMQDFSLFPYLSIKQNIVYGLDDLDSTQRKYRLDKMLELTELQEFRDKLPSELSGGQQQRAAIARALAVEPKLLLLDEPFSNLDKHLVEKLKIEIKTILRTLGITALLITHDQEQALEMGDTVALLSEGKIIQHDEPYQMYHQPISPYAAKFVGKSVFLETKVIGNDLIRCSLGEFKVDTSSFKMGDELFLLLRPEDLVHDDDSSVQAVVVELFFRGNHNLFVLNLPSGERCFSIAPSHHKHLPGSKVGIKLELDHFVLFHKKCFV